MLSRLLTASIIWVRIKRSKIRSRGCCQRSEIIESFEWIRPAECLQPPQRNGQLRDLESLRLIESYWNESQRILRTFEGRTESRRCAR